MELRRISDYEWELPKSGSMRVPARIFASDKLLSIIKNDRTLEQLRNMATLPGIQRYALAMPDAHQGYGFCIGGVVALSKEEGGISPGGVGFDINCGVRVLKSNLAYDDVKPKLRELLEKINNAVPNGLGSESKKRFSRDELMEVLEKGAEYMVSNGYGVKSDLLNCEEGGRMKEADPSLISDKALKRGAPQLGTLGSGNHFVDIHVVDEIYDEEVAKRFGIFEGQVTFMVHCGSRGLGHQVASDYLRIIEKSHPEIVASLPDRELAYAPSGSQEAEDYFKAMSAAANYAWANRQMIMHNIREVVSQMFDNSYESLGLDLHYDVCHNICKVEKHNGVECYVHRKGATRSFEGEKVIIPGSMGTSSYLLVGGKNSLEKSFGSTAHGAGRVMSRAKAKKTIPPEQVEREMKSKGIALISSTIKGMSEESSHVYKDIDEVIRVTDNLGISRKIARLRPIGVING